MQEAEEQGADFIVFGPVYFTPSKANYGAPQGLIALKKIVEKNSVPVYAIGGLKSENILQTKKNRDSSQSTLISAVLSASNPEAAAEEMIAQLRR